MKSSSFLFLSVFLFISSMVNADTPLFSHYPGASVYQSFSQEYATTIVPYAIKGVDGNLKTLVGDTEKVHLTLKNVSSQLVYRNYRDAITAAGFTFSFECELDACGAEREARWLGDKVAISSVYNNYREPYYLVAEKGVLGSRLIVAIFVGGYSDKVGVQQVLIQERKLSVGKVKLDDQVLAKLQEKNQMVVVGELQKGDHSLLPRYPSADLRTSENTDYQNFSLPVLNEGIVEGDASSNLTTKTDSITNASAEATAKPWQELNLVGDLSRHYYVLKNVSTLKIYRNYQAALTQAGFEFLSSCELDMCGTEKQARALGDHISVQSVYNDYRNPYYLLAKKDSVYVAIFVGGHSDSASVQQLILREKALETGLVAISAAGLQRQFAEQGKALVYGIYFDTNMALVKAESESAIQAIAGVLNLEKDLVLYVVGHTDDSGGLDDNITLSQLRAQAIVNVLVQKYGVAPSRLYAHGAGPFSPAANNANNSGRGINRRVELVKRLNP